DFYPRARDISLTLDIAVYTFSTIFPVAHFIKFPSSKIFYTCLIPNIWEMEQDRLILVFVGQYILIMWYSWYSVLNVMSLVALTIIYFCKFKVTFYGSSINVVASRNRQFDFIILLKCPAIIEFYF